MKKVLGHISEANDKFAAIPTEQKERMASLISNFRNQQQQLVASQRIANANVMQPPPIPQPIPPPPVVTPTPSQLPHASPRPLSQSELSTQSPHIQEVDELFNELSLA